jgi:hypothetical protein
MADVGCRGRAARFELCRRETRRIRRKNNDEALASELTKLASGTQTTEKTRLESDGI